MTRSAFLGASVRVAALNETSDIFRRFEARGTEYAEHAISLAEGTLDGVAGWLMRTHGRQAAYDFLQRKADEIATALVADQGSKSHDEEKANGGERQK
jgi:type IV secretory pathway VirB6-like protein